jgi:cytoskeletal protein CcmA (bactofilin family)
MTDGIRPSSASFPPNGFAPPSVVAAGDAVVVGVSVDGESDVDGGVVGATNASVVTVEPEARVSGELDESEP